MQTRLERSTRAAFSVLETGLSVLACVLLVVALFVWILPARHDARVLHTQWRLQQVDAVLLRYRDDTGSYPEEGPGALRTLLVRPPGDGAAAAQIWRGPYVESAEWLEDAWGRPFEYRLVKAAPDDDTSLRPRLWSRGADGEPGTEDDLTALEP